MDDTPGMPYCNLARRLIGEVAEAQAQAVAQAADWVHDSLASGGVWHVFGTGHSHMAAEELYFRAGGLAPVNAILFPALMQHEGPVTSTRLERLPGLARIVLDRAGIEPGEVLTIVSNSGRNAVPVELATLARERGARIVAITALAHAHAAPPDPRLGYRLDEASDLVINNGGVPGDAAMSLPGTDLAAGPTSSLINIALLQEIAHGVCLRYLARGEQPPVFRSANLPGGDAWNAALVARYGARVNFR